MDNPYLNLCSSTFTRTKNTSEDHNNDNGNDNRDLTINNYSILSLKKVNSDISRPSIECTSRVDPNDPALEIDPTSKKFDTETSSPDFNDPALGTDPNQFSLLDLIPHHDITSPNMVDISDIKQGGILTDYETDSIRDSLIQHTKLGNIKISKALARSTNRTQVRSSLKIYECSKHISWINDGRRAVSLSRCHSRLCPICNRIKSKQYATHIRRSIDQLKYELIGDYNIRSIPKHRRMIGLKLTINSGETCTLDQIRTRLRAMHKIYGRLIKTKSISEHLIGSIRSSEIVQTKEDENRAHPHIHSLLLLSNDVNVLDLSDHISKYWTRAIKKELLRQTKENIDTSNSFNSLEPLREHNKDDVYDWVKYITKGSYDLGRSDQRESFKKTTDSFWVAIDKALKGMRMISISGDLKEAYALTKAQHESRRSIHNEYTHTWSDLSQRYVEKDKYDPAIEPYSLSSSLSYATDQSMNLSVLFKNEHEKRQAEVNMMKYKHTFQTLLTSKNYSFIERINHLIIDKHKNVNDHFTEPTEVERSSLVEKRNQRLLSFDPNTGELIP